MNSRSTIFGLMALGLLVALGLSVEVRTAAVTSVAGSGISYGSFPVAEARAETPPVGPTRQNDVPAPNITAKSAIVVDMETGHVLFEHNAEEPAPMASITKLATALTALDLGILDGASIRITKEDVRTGGIQYVLPGEAFAPRDLFTAMLVGSENTAATAIARTSAGSPELFTEDMNALADRLGLATASFAEPTGLDPENKASVRDLAHLARAAFEVPVIAEALREPSMRLTPLSGEPVRRVHTTNAFLTEPTKEYTLESAKTGFTDEAGYTYVIAADGAEGERVLVALLGASTAESRYADADTLIRWAFDSWAWK